MSKQRWGNAIASLLLLIVAIVDFTRDSSGIGGVFFTSRSRLLGASSIRQSKKGPHSLTSDAFAVAPQIGKGVGGQPEVICRLTKSVFAI
jgi:hypothetical protein